MCLNERICVTFRSLDKASSLDLAENNPLPSPDFHGALHELGLLGLVGSQV